MPDALANRRGIVAIMTAMAFYGLNDALIKLALPIYPTGQVLTIRGLAASLVITLLTRTSLAQIRTALREPSLVVRGILEISTAITSVLALARASLGIVGAVMMTAPLLVALVSMMLRWEPVHPRRLIAGAIGFAGALLILRPSTQATGIGAALACLCAISLAGRELATRRLPATLSSTTVAAITTLAVCTAGPVLGSIAGERWGSLARVEALALAGAAVCSAAGNYALIAACRDTDLSVVTPFRYSFVVWTSVMGYAIWGETPDAAAVGGMVAIVGAGILSLRAARMN